METQQAFAQSGAGMGMILGAFTGIGLFALCALRELERRCESERETIEQIVARSTSSKRAWRKVMAMKLMPRHSEHFRRLLDEHWWHNPYDHDGRDEGRGADLSWVVQIEVGGEG